MIETQNGEQETVTVKWIPELRAGDRLTRAEFERRYQAVPHLKKAELIEGVVYMPSPCAKCFRFCKKVWPARNMLISCVGCRIRKSRRSGKSEAKAERCPTTRAGVEEMVLKSGRKEHEKTSLRLITAYPLEARYD